MTKTAQNTVAKLGVAFVAAAMLFSFVAPAKAQTVEELQAQIAALMAQISALQTTTAGVSSTTGCVSIPAPLTIGSEGADVTALQNFLISAGMTIPAGATGYFGSQTQAALASWQAANGVSPAAGYYGPITKAAVDAKCVVTTPAEEEGEGEEEGSSMTLQGEGDLASVDIDDADDVMEGEDDAELATLTLEAEDGDIEVSRLSFELALDSGSATTDENDVYDVFEDITLWVDGDKIATFDASDEDEYLDEDEGTFRISGLDLVIEEDEEVEIVIAGTISSSIDGVMGTTKATWNLDFTGLRFFDAEGVATTYTAADTVIGTQSVDVVIAQEGYDDDASIESNSDTPDAATLKVDEDTADSDEYEIFVFDIEVDKDSSDLVLNDMAYVDVTVKSPTTVVGGADDILAEVWLDIDGEMVEGDEVDSGTLALDLLSDPLATNTPNTIRYEFDFDNMDFEADETYTATLSIVFKGQDNNYVNGVVVSAFVDGTKWEMEGLADDAVLTGTNSSKDFTLATVVPVISTVSSSAKENDTNSAGTVSFKFTVEAEDDDIIGFDVNDIMDTIAGGSLEPNPVLVKTAGDATETATGVWTIQDGDDASFALTYTFSGASSSDNGSYFVTLDSVLGVDVDETSDPVDIIIP